MKKITTLFGVACLLLTLGLTACGGTGTSNSPNSVTVYSADGLGDWYKEQFGAFTKSTGIRVNYVEGGSGQVVARALTERARPQGDLLVTLPPFIQQAQDADLLQPTTADLSSVSVDDKDSQGDYVDLVQNYFTMIMNTQKTKPIPTTWNDLLNPAYKGKIQYSTPGQAGDGTALLVLLEHVMGTQQALDYLGKLQVNNVGPSTSTGALGPKVAKGELWIANSDFQMAAQSISQGANYEVFFPAQGSVRTTIPVPYVMGVIKNARHAENANKLIAFLLSAQVQQTVSSEAFGFPVNTQVTPTDSNYTTMTKTLNGVTIWNPDWSIVSKNFNNMINQYKKATKQ